MVLDCGATTKDETKLEADADRSDDAMPPLGRELEDPPNGEVRPGVEG